MRYNFIHVQVMLFMLQFNLWFNLFMYFIFFCQKLGPDRIRKSCYSWYNLTCVFLFMSNQGNLKFFSTFSRLFLTFRCLTWFETNSYFVLPETRTGPDPQVVLFMLFFSLFVVWPDLKPIVIFFCLKLGPDRIRKSCYSCYNLTCEV